MTSIACSGMVSAEEFSEELRSESYSNISSRNIEEVLIVASTFVKFVYKMSCAFHSSVRCAVLNGSTAKATGNFPSVAKVFTARQSILQGTQ